MNSLFPLFNKINVSTYLSTSYKCKEVFFHGHKTKSIVFGHTHKKIVFKIFNYFFINFLFIIKKIFFYVCVTKHFLFGLVIILEFLVSRGVEFSFSYIQILTFMKYNGS